jgi:chaperonin GroL
MTANFWMREDETQSAPNETLAPSRGSVVIDSINGIDPKAAMRLGHAIMSEALEKITPETNQVLVHAGIRKAIDAVVDEIARQSRQISSHDQVVAEMTRLTGDHEMGRLVADVLEAVGTDGAVRVEEGDANGLDKEYAKGAQLNQGFASACFVTDSDRMEAVLDNPKILIADWKISRLPGLLVTALALLEKDTAAGRPLVIIGADYAGEVLAAIERAFVEHHIVRGRLLILAVMAPDPGGCRNEMLQDIAILTGGRILRGDGGRGIESFNLADLGEARRVVATRGSTTIIDGAGRPDAVRSRVDQIRSQIQIATSDEDREQLQLRLARLAGDVGIIKVGSSSKGDLRRKRQRLEAALSSVRAGLREGICAGGGTTLLHCQRALAGHEHEEPDVRIGVDAVREALECQIWDFAEDAGADGEAVIARVRELPVGQGYDASRGDYGDLFERGLVEPAWVVRSTLQFAASIAVTALTTTAPASGHASAPGPMGPTEEPSLVAERQSILLRNVEAYWARQQALDKEWWALWREQERERDDEIARTRHGWWLWDEHDKHIEPLPHARLKAKVEHAYQKAAEIDRQHPLNRARHREALRRLEECKRRGEPFFHRDDSGFNDSRPPDYYSRPSELHCMYMWLMNTGDYKSAGGDHWIDLYLQIPLGQAERDAEHQRLLAQVAALEEEAVAPIRERYLAKEREMRVRAGLDDEDPLQRGQGVITDLTLLTALDDLASRLDLAAWEFVATLGFPLGDDGDPEIDVSRALLTAIAERRDQADAAGPRLGKLEYPVASSGCQPDASGLTRIGIVTDEDLASLPAILSLGAGAHFFFAGVPGERPSSLLRSVLLRQILGSQPGSVELTLIDPVGAGAGLAAFLALPVEFRGSKVLVRPDEIEAQLRELNRVVESTIQTRLGTKFKTLAEYNEANPAVAEATRLVAILGLPAGGWTERHVELLVPLLRNGPRAGVHVLATIDPGAQVPRGVDVEALTGHGLRITLDAGGHGRLYLPESTDAYEFLADEMPDAHLVEGWLKAWAEAAEGSRSALGHSAISVPADWSGSSIEGLEVPIGLDTEGHIHDFSLGSGTVHHALVGGMSGSGKTNLLRLLIAQLASRYSPDELALYLLDFKAGVAFADYLDLPNARAVSLETEREFALSMLRHLQGEIESRAKLFRASSVDEFVPYRRTGKPLARLLLIMDEFQVLFSEDDALARDAARILEDLVKRGRSFGIHILLASQSPSLATLAGQRIYNQMGLRIAFRCLSQDALAILGEGNTGATELDEPGEAIYNDELGAREHNRRIKVALLTPDEHKGRIEAISALAGGRYPNPVTFEGATPASIERNAILAAALTGETRPGSPDSVEILLGEPVELKATTSAVLERYPRSNLLIAGSAEEVAYGLLGAVLLSIAAAQPAAHIHIIDLARPTAPVAGVLGRLSEPFGERVERCGPRETSALVGRLVALLDERLAGADAAEPHYLLVAGLQRWRELRGVDYQQTPEAKALLRLLDEGPDQGISTIVWTDTIGALDKVKSRAWGFFDLRVALHLSESESTNLLGGPIASRLTDNRALYRHEDWPAGQFEKFKPYRVGGEQHPGPVI